MVAEPAVRARGIVGRQRELDLLLAQLGTALAGAGSTALVAGEPGIGKTRLVEELATAARRQGVHVLWGRCYEGEGAPAFWPWVQILRAALLGRAAEELRAIVGSAGPLIAQLVPELRQALPELPEPSPLPPDQARFLLFDTIATALKRLAAAQPLCLVLDDLHWADAASLLLIEFIARELQEAPILLTAAYRDVEVGRGHAAARTIAEIARIPRSRRLELRGLDEQATACLATMMAGVRPSASVIEAVYHETEGNPFFIAEVVRLLDSEGRLQRRGELAPLRIGVPETVREVIGRRLARLSPVCREALATAAVIGRAFTLGALQQSLATGAGVAPALAGDGTLIDLLDEAVTAQIVAELPGAFGRYRFTHALIRETLYEGLPAGRRVRLHRQVGEALARSSSSRPEPYLAELAYHFTQAAPVVGAEEAAGYARRAADHARTQLAFEEAARLYRMALDVLDLEQLANENQRCELLLALADAANSAHDREAAREAALEAAGATILGRAEPGAGTTATATHAPVASAQLDRYPDRLTEREVEVLRLLAGGQTSKEIAQALVLSAHTVDNHTANIYAKIGARRRGDATAYAARHGFV